MNWEWVSVVIAALFVVLNGSCLFNTPASNHANESLSSLAVNFVSSEFYEFYEWNLLGLTG